MVVFHYAPGRAEHAKAPLGDYSGIPQCDGYGAYKTLAAVGGGITLAFCWSQLRREFIDLAKGKAAPIAQKTLQRIAALYAVEVKLRGKPSDLRRAGWQQRSRPLVEDLFAWLSAQWHACRAAAPRRGPSATCRTIAMASSGSSRVVGSSWTIILSSGPSGRSASTGKTRCSPWDDGGARWAAAAFLVETCKLDDVGPQRHFTDVLTRLVSSRPSDCIDEPRPRCWATDKSP
ncbi:MAG: transposase [Acetobacteraceae bacterium]|nr:MAG: transposase [Acetobacteraceae bacterium]